ncbi:MAG: DUF2752 domain-containing protein [Spirosomaceae bacterium]|jgi:uncharacterized integral membrane protein|nr:DUF2752 domain-containing protein [Spirosomataceae bacterium]
MFRKIVITVTAVALTVFYFYHDPAVRPFGPRCIVHQTTGWYCWGCGGQRAFHALMHGKFRDAFQFNLLIYSVLPLLSLVIYTEWFDDKRPLRYLRLRQVALGVLLFVLIFTVVRNLPYFTFIRP